MIKARRCRPSNELRERASEVTREICFDIARAMNICSMAEGSRICRSDANKLPYAGRKGAKLHERDEHFQQSLACRFGRNISDLVRFWTKDCHYQVIVCTNFIWLEGYMPPRIFFPEES